VTVEFLILSFHGGISFSIVTKKEKYNTLIEMMFVRALLPATRFSSAARRYEPLRSEFQFGSALL